MVRELKKALYRRFTRKLVMILEEDYLNSIDSLLDTLKVVAIFVSGMAVMYAWLASNNQILALIQ